MNVVVTPKKLAGTVTVPASKSIGHRELICAALAEGESTVSNITVSDDISATCRLLQQMGARIRLETNDGTGRSIAYIHGGLQHQEEPFTVDCGESGSTLRFLIPVGLANSNDIIYTGHGQLVKRPLQPYYDLFRQRHIRYETKDGGLPLHVVGQLTSGQYALPGNISSQFFSGLLMALPLVQGDSLLCSTTKLESASYVELTLDCLRRHGVTVTKKEEGRFLIPGGQHFRAGQYVTEGDYSQAAFWLAAGLLGDTVSCKGLACGSCQGDKAILPIIREMGGRIDMDSIITAHPSGLKGKVIDVSDCPDLVPILTVLASLSRGTTHIVNAGRVRLKECDRLHAMSEELNTLGAHIKEEPEGLIIQGVSHLQGGHVHSWNDHRVAMSLAIATQCCSEEVVIEDAGCVRKSYPAFWQDFISLGGSVIQEDLAL